MTKAPILLVIGYVWPEPNSSAAGKRMLQLMQVFTEHGWHIVFATAAKKSGFEFDLSQLQIEWQEIELNEDSFNVFVANLMPRAVLYDRFMMEEQFGWRVRKECRQALQILDTEDLHFLRHARQLANKESRELSLLDLQSDMAKREIASILRCDISLIISEHEMDLLQHVFHINPQILWYYPLFVEAPSKALLSFQERKDFVFIGNFWHEPNWQALRNLKEFVWPKLAKLVPGAKLQIYGAYAAQKVLELHNEKQRFLVNGRAEDAEEVLMQARVSLAPLTFGAGLKGKLLESMNVGTPSVTTTIGAEGIAEVEDWPGFATNDLTTFAQLAAKLYQDENDWNNKQQKGFALLEARFRPNLFEHDWMEQVNWLLAHLEDHRMKNFMGAILQHHTLASTEYMSRWIQEKNKPH
jgi:glycosyltransferase involved in cell wall biosynthesis